MTRDSLRSALESWRAQGVPIDEARREQLRETTVERIREAMEVASRARRRRSWAIGALLAAVAGVGAAAAALGVSSTLRPAAGSTAIVVAHAELYAQSGSPGASLRREGRDLDLQHGPVALQVGDTVSAGTRAAVDLTLPDAGQASLEPQSELEVTRAAHLEQHFVLRRGHLAVTIPAESPHRNLQVETPHAAVSVVGTVFAVRVFGSGEMAVTEVTVTRGRVHVVPRQAPEVWLTAGQAWRSDAAELAAGATTETDEPSADAVPERSAGGPLPPASRGPTTLPTGPQNPSTLAEQNRVYRAALDARNGGDDARAVTLLDSLITRFPSSPLRQEAEVERFRALNRIGRSGDATRAARRYLSEYDGGFARDEAEALALPSAQSRPAAAP